MLPILSDIQSFLYWSLWDYIRRGARRLPVFNCLAAGRNWLWMGMILASLSVANGQSGGFLQMDQVQFSDGSASTCVAKFPFQVRIRTGGGKLIDITNKINQKVNLDLSDYREATLEFRLKGSDISVSNCRSSDFAYAFFPKKLTYNSSHFRTSVSDDQLNRAARPVRENNRWFTYGFTIKPGSGGRAFDDGIRLTFGIKHIQDNREVFPGNLNTSITVIYRIIPPDPDASEPIVARTEPNPDPPAEREFTRGIKTPDKAGKDDRAAREATAWANVRKADSPEAYRNFLRDYPDSKNRKTAREYLKRSEAEEKEKIQADKEQKRIASQAPETKAEPEALVEFKLSVQEEDAQSGMLRLLIRHTLASDPRDFSLQIQRNGEPVPNNNYRYQPHPTRTDAGFVYEIEELVSGTHDFVVTDAEGTTSSLRYLYQREGQGARLENDNRQVRIWGVPPPYSFSWKGFDGSLSGKDLVLNSTQPNQRVFDLPQRELQRAAQNGRVELLLKSEGEPFTKLPYENASAGNPILPWLMGTVGVIVLIVIVYFVRLRRADRRYRRRPSQYIHNSPTRAGGERSSSNQRR